MCCGSETVAYLRLIDSCITQLKAQGPSRTCNESKEEEKKKKLGGAVSYERGTPVLTYDDVLQVDLFFFSTLKPRVK